MSLSRGRYGNNRARAARLLFLPKPAVRFQAICAKRRRLVVGSHFCTLLRRAFMGKHLDISSTMATAVSILLITLGCIVVPIGAAMIFRPRWPHLAIAYALWFGCLLAASGGGWRAALFVATMFSSLVVPTLTWAAKSLAD